MNRGTPFFRPLKSLLCMLLVLTLSGCDDKSTPTNSSQPASSVANTSTPVANPENPANKNTSNKQTTAETATKPELTSAEKAELAKRYTDKILEIVDVSELQIDGASTLVATFSIPLDPKQNFDQLVHLVDSASGKVDGSWELAPNLMELRMRHLEPERKLIFSADTELQGISGQTLTDSKSHPVRVEISTSKIYPSVGFSSRGSLLPAKVAEGLPIIALNVNSVDVNFFRIKPEFLLSVVSAWEGKTSIRYWESDDFLKMADLVYGGRFDLNPQRNTRENLLLPLQSVKPLQEPGVYLAAMQEAGTYQNYTIPATMFTLSDIGLSVRSSSNSYDAFTLSLESGETIKDVKIQLLDEKGKLISEATTDKQGHARLDKDSKGRLILATHDGQTSMIALNKAALDLSEFTIAGPQGFNSQFFVFGPRDIYRPGETAVINGLLRDQAGNPLPEQPINVELVRPDGQVVRTFAWQPENGLYQFKYDIPDNAPTGSWQLRMKLGDTKERYYSFKVEDFLPERMALDISVSSQPLPVNSELSFNVTGRYLYGAPASGNRLQGQLFLRPLRDAVAKLPGFEFGNINDSSYSRRLNEFEQVLDNSGKTTVTTYNEWSSSRSPLNVIMQASLLESGGRPVTRTASQAIWPAKNLPAIRPLFNKSEVYDYRTDRYKSQYTVDEESQAEFSIVYTNIDGDKLAADDLEVSLIRERRDYYWNWSEYDGWQSGYNQKDLVMDSSRISIDNDSIAKVSFPVDWGSYRLEVKDTTTGVISSVRFWAGYSWQENTGNGGGVRPDQVKLKLDKPAYRPGDKVKLNVEAPTAGRGYLMVESAEGPLWWQEIDVPVGGTDFELPINKEWDRHDLYISALVVRPADKTAHATPKRAVGILHLPMADPARKINLKVDAPSKIESNQTLKVKVSASVNDGKPNKPVTVLVSAVDTGVLNITEFKTPDPYDAFFGRKRYDISHYDVYGTLIEGKGRLASLRFGGDGDDEGDLSRGGKKPVTRVQIVALQSQPVILNDQGEAEVELPIPDFNGELRLMVQAWSEQDFGSTESLVTVAAPLIAELGMPRFMAGGDQSLLTLDLNNLSDNPQALRLDVTTTNMLKLTQPISESISLEKGAKTARIIPIKAANGLGSGDIIVKISGLKVNGQERIIERKWTLGVRPAFPAQTYNYSEVLAQGQSFIVPDNLIKNLDPSTVNAELLLTSRPPLNLAHLINQLYAYPYGCAEQTTSGLFPSLYTNTAQLTALGIKTSSDEERRQNINIGIERLLAMQRSNGSFGLWDSQGDEEFWLTAYVTDFLFRARAQGYGVPDANLDKATERLQRYLQDRTVIEAGSSQDADHTRFAVQAYAGLVLARQQKASLGALRELYQHRSDARSGLPLVQLAVALQKMGDTPRSQLALAEGLAKPRDTKKYWWFSDYGSEIRDDALILSLLIENDLEPDAQNKRLISLSDKMMTRGYLSTQENNAIFMAGRDSIGQTEKPWTIELENLLSNQPTVIDSKTSRSVGFDSTELDNFVSMSNTGQSTVYSRLNISGYPLKAPEPSSNNVNIERQFFDIHGITVNLNSLKSGELVIVYLRVTTPLNNLPDALVVDLLPAGLELENQNLANSSASLSTTADALKNLLSKMQSTPILHQEFRDDRYVAAVKVREYQPAVLLYLARAVTPGTYQIPAPYVESMYQPEWRAIGKTPQQLTVH